MGLDRGFGFWCQQVWLEKVRVRGEVRVRVGWVRRNSSAGSKWYGCGGTFEDLEFIGLSSGVGLSVE